MAGPLVRALRFDPLGSIVSKGGAGRCRPAAAVVLAGVGFPGSRASTVRSDEAAVDHAAGLSRAAGCCVCPVQSRCLLLLRPGQLSSRTSIPYTKGVVELPGWFGTGAEPAVGSRRRHKGRCSCCSNAAWPSPTAIRCWAPTCSDHRGAGCAAAGLVGTQVVVHARHLAAQRRSGWWCSIRWSSCISSSESHNDALMIGLIAAGFVLALETASGPGCDGGQSGRGGETDRVARPALPGDHLGGPYGDVRKPGLRWILTLFITIVTFCHPGA